MLRLFGGVLMFCRLLAIGFRLLVRTRGDLRALRGIVMATRDARVVYVVLVLPLLWHVSPPVSMDCVSGLPAEPHITLGATALRSCANRCISR